MSTFTAPTIYWAGLAPALVILGAAVLGVLLEAFVPRRWRLGAQAVLALGAIVCSAVLLVGQWDVLTSVPVPVGLEITVGYFLDPFGVAAQGILLAIGLLAVLTMVDRTSARDGAFAAQAADRPGRAEETESLHAGWMGTEVLPLTMFSLGGMMLFPLSSNFISLFVMLELVSLPLYVMAATARHRRLLSQEAALKYFVLGAFSSAFLLLGAALLYGASGTVELAAVAQFVRLSGGAAGVLVPVGVLLLLVGLLFKIAAAPFHAWSPDVYQGAPTPVTGFMAAGVKATAFLALLRVFVSLAYVTTPVLEPVLVTVAVLTMVLGTVVGLVQRDVKRMLAYSAIAHAGYMLIGLIALNVVSVHALLLYSLVYGVATVGAFGVVSLVRTGHDGAAGAEATSLDAYRGLGRRSPWLALALTVFLLSFAGIPLTAGFVAKFELFVAAATSGYVWLVVVAVVSSAATAFFYTRLLVLMYFREPEGDGVVVVSSRGPVAVAVTVAVVLTVLLGVLPEPLMVLLRSAVMLTP